MNTVLSQPVSALDGLIRELCVRLPASVGASGLAQALTAALSSRTPDLVFRDVLTRGGWYRRGRTTRRR